ncbi:hypothetical protein ABIB82_007666 [Bradyrhizobium sp. i1.8.4]
MGFIHQMYQNRYIEAGLSQAPDKWDAPSRRGVPSPQRTARGQKSRIEIIVADTNVI